MITVDTYTNANEASRAFGSDSAIMGGGTLLMGALNYGRQNFTKIIRITDPVMKQIADAGDRIAIGAGVTMSEVIRSRDLAFLAPVAQSVGGPAIRNMATLGGNLFAGTPYGDFTVALLALDGIVKYANGSEQDLEGFLASRGNRKDLVVSVSVKKPAANEFRYRKVVRVKPMGRSVLSIAARLPTSAGRIANSRVAFGAMGTTPLRAKAVESALDGAALDLNGIQAALAAVSNEFQPPDDALASGWYRNEIAPVYLRRLLLNEGVSS